MADLTIENQHVLDEANAKSLFKSISDLNALIRACHRAGLRIEVDKLEHHSIADRFACPILTVTVSRVL